MNPKKILIAMAAGLCAAAAPAQAYSIDWHSLAGGGGTSTGGGYSLSAAIGQFDAGPMSGGGYTLEGGFGGILASITGLVTIFDNTGGTDNGYQFATTTTWLANKFCLGSQSYQLDSVTLLLVSGDNNGEPRIRNVRLEIYANDPATGTPSVSTGVIMNLSGATNPIALPIAYIQAPVTWAPATPFTLAAETCYWAVLSLESGASVGMTASSTSPTGDAGTFGLVLSSDAGATWEEVNNFSNRKMLIKGTALSTAPQLIITAVERIGNALRLSFTSISGKSYTVQTRTDLATGMWESIPDPPIAGTGGPLQVTFPIALDQPQQFYRMLVGP